MKLLTYHILRFGLGITFIWIGIYIVRNPEAWSAYIRPWMLALLPASPERTMFANGLLDIAIGGLLLFNIFPWLIAALASIHLAIILIVSGINEITVRDIGLLGATLALGIATWPQSPLRRFLP